MTFLRYLVRTELRVLAAVVLVSAVAAAAVYVSARAHPGGLLPPSDWARLAFLYALAFGLPVAAVVGAPVYALLQRKGRATWPLVLAIGFLPGVLVLAATGLQDSLGPWFMGCGPAVAGLTHLMARADRSLRGSADAGTSP